jgi:hypothetical protein
MAGATSRCFDVKGGSDMYFPGLFGVFALILIWKLRSYN